MSSILLKIVVTVCSVLGVLGMAVLVAGGICFNSQKDVRCDGTRESYEIMYISGGVSIALCILVAAAYLIIKHLYDNGRRRNRDITNNTI